MPGPLSPLRRRFLQLTDLGRITSLSYSPFSPEIRLVTENLKRAVGEEISGLVVDLRATGARCLAMALENAVTHELPIAAAYVEITRKGHLLLDDNGLAICDGVDIHAP